MLSKLIAILALGSSLGIATPYRYDLSVPAVTTGPVQGSAFSLSFTLPNLLLAYTDITNQTTFTIPNLIDPAYSGLSSISVGPPSLGINYAPAIPGEGLSGSALPFVPMDHPGVFDVGWQLLHGSAGSPQVFGGTITITDLGTAGIDPPGVPEPSTAALAILGLAALIIGSPTWQRRRHLKSFVSKVPQQP